MKKQNFWQKIPLLFVCLFTTFILSGCVNYDLGINFDNPHYGQLVQHIKLGDQLQSFNSETQQWLDSIQQRTKQLGGKVKRISKQELFVQIPFYNGHELEQKFNQFFQTDNKSDKKSQDQSSLPAISSHLTVQQGNFIFLIRNHLIYDLDLRSLALISNQGNVIVSAGSLMDLKFTVNGTWSNKTLAIKPGELNHLEVTFWQPSPLGIGAFIILGIVLGGFYIKYKEIPVFTAKTEVVT
jgi:Protein of unknown function (DUF3153)